VEIMQHKLLRKLIRETFVLMEGEEGEIVPNFTKYEYSIVNYLNKNASPKSAVEHKGGFASYDVHLHSPVAINSIRLEPGKYEVKQDTGKGRKVRLARLGNDKAKQVLVDDFMRSLVSLGAAIQHYNDEMKDDEIVNTIKNYFNQKASSKSRIPRYEQLLGLELSESIFNEIFKSETFKKKCEEAYKNLKSKVGNKKFKNVKSDADVSYSADGTQEKIGKANIAKLVRIDKIINSKDNSSKAEDLLGSLSRILEVFPDSVADSQILLNDIIKRVTASEKGFQGFFAIRKNGEARFVPNDALEIFGVTQGGRLIMGTDDKSMMICNLDMPLDSKVDEEIAYKHK